MQLTERMTREEQHMVGRVVNRLRMKPVYATLRYCADVWGFSIHYVSTLSLNARSPLLITRYDY